MSKDQKNKEENAIRELVIARIDVMPSNFKLSVGNRGTFTKNELIEHIMKGDEIGNQVVNMQLNFIKALTSGELTQALTQ